MAAILIQGEDMVTTEGDIRITGGGGLTIAAGHITGAGILTTDGGGLTTEDGIHGTGDTAPGTARGILPMGIFLLHQPSM